MNMSIWYDNCWTQEWAAKVCLGQEGVSGWIGVATMGKPYPDGVGIQEMEPYALFTLITFNGVTRETVPILAGIPFQKLLLEWVRRHVDLID